MKRLEIDYKFKEVEIEIERQAIGDEEVVHIKTTPLIWCINETFDDVTAAAKHLAGCIESTLANMAHNNANKIHLQCKWE